MITQQSFSILFWIIKSREKDGKAPLSARITVNGKRAELATQREVMVSLWDAKAQKMKGSSQEAKGINMHLDVIRGSLHTHHSRLISLGKTVTAEILKLEYLGIRAERKSLCEVFDFHLKQYKEKAEKQAIAPATLDKYNYTFGKVKAFLQHHYKVKDIFLEDIEPSFVYDFEHYLVTVDNLINNTAMKYIRQLKTILIMATERGWLKINPLASFKCSFDEKDPLRLEMDELNSLASKRILIPRLAEARDCYVFMCYTGYAYEDAHSLTPANIFLGIDRNEWITKDRQKTDSTECVPLLPTALEIIKKYKKHPYCSVHNKLLPVRSNQKFNGYLKEIAAICGIDKELTTHTARHTFATTVTLENDVPIETVSKMLGHKSIKTTQRYAKVTRKKISNNMDVLKNKLFGANAVAKGA